MWPWWWPWRLLFQSLCSCDLHSQNVFGTWKKKRKGNPNEIYPICNWCIYYICNIYPEIFQIPTNLKKLPIFTVANPHLHRRNLGGNTTGIAKLTRQKRFEKPRDFLVRKYFEKIIVPNLYFEYIFFRLEEFLTFQESFLITNHIMFCLGRCFLFLNF